MQKFNNLIVLSPLIYLVHHFEEHIIFNFKEWRLSYFLDNNPLTSEEMLIRLAAFSLIIIFVHQIKQNRASALLVLYFVMTTQVVNAVFHIFFSFYFADFSPGAITGVLLYLPVNYLIYKAAINEGYIKNNVEIVSNWWYPNLSKFQTKKHKYALAIGRLEKIKGFDLLISSWRNIDKELLIIGSGKEKENLMSLIERYGLSKKIKILENIKREDLKNYYKDASVLIVSSRDEGGPRVALEALFLEVPVLSTNVGHMSNILPQELLANKNDQKSLQKLLERYVDNIDLLNQEAIFDFVTKEYSIEKKINEIQKIYYSVLNS